MHIQNMTTHACWLLSYYFYIQAVYLRKVYTFSSAQTVSFLILLSAHFNQRTAPPSHPATYSTFRVHVMPLQLVRRRTYSTRLVTCMHLACPAIPSAPRERSGAYLFHFPILRQLLHVLIVVEVSG
jgi:hypothetical protein